MEDRVAMPSPSFTEQHACAWWKGRPMVFATATAPSDVEIPAPQSITKTSASRSSRTSSVGGSAGAAVPGAGGSAGFG